MDMKDFISGANTLGESRTPFIFVIDFELTKPFLCTVRNALKKNIFFKIGKIGNYRKSLKRDQKISLDISPISYKKYKVAFDKVVQQILEGNTYLLNLTFPTEIKTEYRLKEFFHFSRAPYKLFFNEQFIVFSPECFVKTQSDYIYSYPMKGTINAALPDAARLILENKKEEWEHNTIVDLIRNDLALVSKDITVTKFRFLSEIFTSQKNLLQVSSEIRGMLPTNWQETIGEILIKLLPAGSISGAPKQKTLQIIKQVEQTNRGYFSGIFGIFDGENIDSAVTIRFIEKNGDGLQFRSGGGITANSNPLHEYNEMIDKVYVPIR